MNKAPTPPKPSIKDDILSLYNKPPQPIQQQPSPYGMAGDPYAMGMAQQNPYIVCWDHCHDTTKQECIWRSFILVQRS